MRRFAGRRAVVSGAAGDVGRLLCRGLAEDGASVVGVDVAADAGQAFEREMGRDGLAFEFRAVDLADPDAVASFGAAGGPVDILINNAGVLHMSPLLETSVETWDRVQAINLRAPFLLTKALAPRLTENSAVLNVSSVGALLGTAGFTAYAAAKAGLVALTRVLAAELAPRTRVNAVCPGPLDTAMPRAFFEGHPAKQAIADEMNRRNLLQRIGRAEDIVPLCLLLVSDDARLMTGSTVVIDAGMTL